MRFMLLALLGLSMAGAASAAPDRGRSHGVSQAGPTRVTTSHAAASTRGAVARQATSRRPSAQPVSRHAGVSARQSFGRGQARGARQARGSYGRPSSAYGSRYARAPFGRGAGRGGYYQTASRGGAASCGRGARAGRCGGERRFAWQSGLPQAAGVQTISCPSGTVETPALGHTTIMRCMPL